MRRARARRACAFICRAPSRQALALSRSPKASATSSCRAGDRPWSRPALPGRRLRPTASAPDPTRLERIMSGTVPLLAVTDLAYAYNGVAAVRGVSLEVGAGEVVALLGAN